MPEARPAALVRSDLPLPLVHSGKVREMYDAGEERLLMVASDRVSAFDVVMSEPIPRKGEVLTMVTVWWLQRLAGISPHHGITAHPDEIVQALPMLDAHRDQWAGRALLVRRTSPLPVECVVRGYLSGSAWREYRERGTLAGEPLPEGLVESQLLERPLFSPATKAVEGHDENIPYEGVVERLGEAIAERLRARSLALYAEGARLALDRGLILADTKFEFGTSPDGELLLIDEVLTPDSSRYWPRESHRTGRTPPSLDKQPVRDYLDSLGDWAKRPPPPALPEQVVRASTRRYLELFRSLTGVELDRFRLPRSLVPSRDP